MAEKKSSQIKSKQRVADHGEVFTNPREVNAMLDLVKQETERIDSRFLEPACGNGNFLAEILNRKLAVIADYYRKSKYTQLEYERNAVMAVSSIYGIEILPDNAEACRKRLLDIFIEQYNRLFKDKCKPECEKSVRYLLDKNIVCGDALDMTTVEEPKRPIVLAEWSFIGDGMVKRRNYSYDFMVKKTHQFSLFDEQGNAASIDKPVDDDYPIVHFLNLNATTYGK